MNALSILSVIFAVISLIQIGLVLLVDEAFIIAAIVNVFISVYLDHLGIEKSLRDFLAEGRAKR